MNGEEKGSSISHYASFCSIGNNKKPELKKVSSSRFTKRSPAVAKSFSGLDKQKREYHQKYSIDYKKSSKMEKSCQRNPSSRKKQFLPDQEYNDA